MKRQNVKSSNVRSIGYYEELKILEVEFMSNDVYQYLEVPENIFVEVMTAPSIGSAIHKILRGTFKFKKVS